MSLETKVWSKASERGGENGIQDTKTRVASGKKGLIVLFPSEGADGGIGRQLEAVRSVAMCAERWQSNSTLWFAEPWVGGGHGGKGPGTS